jgi:hypothetical protein
MTKLISVFLNKNHIRYKVILDNDFMNYLIMFTLCQFGEPNLKNDVLKNYHLTTWIDLNARIHVITINSMKYYFFTK